MNIVGILDHDDFRSLVEDSVLSAAAVEAPNYPIQLDNVPFDQPKNGGWISLCIQTGDSISKSLGSKFIERTPGFVQIDITIPKDKGHAAVNRLAHKLCDSLAYRSLTRATVAATFWKKTVTSGAPVTGPFYRVMGRVFFHYDGMIERPAVGM